jgi:hypothetical protein
MALFYAQVIFMEMRALFLVPERLHILDGSRE